MIEVSFTRPGNGPDRVIFATIRVDDAGAVTSSGDGIEQLTAVEIPDSSRPDGVLRFADDPAAWIRDSRKAFRTPYAVPVISDPASS